MNGTRAAALLRQPERRGRSTCSSARSACATRSRSRSGSSVDEDTVPLAELLLTKLQIIELNEKDVRDTVALLARARGDRRRRGRQRARSSPRSAATTGGSAARSRRTSRASASISADYEVDRRRRRRRGSTRSSSASRRTPKSRSWKLRAKVGERKRWYRAARRGLDSAMRIFFATDVHGSETCWRKFLNAGAHYQADVLVLGGDMTGKALVPIIHDGGGNWHATLLENRQSSTARRRWPRSRTRSSGAATTRSAPIPRSCSELHDDESALARASSRRRCSRRSRSGWTSPTSASAGTGMRVLLLPGQRRSVRGRRGHRAGEARRARRGARRRHRRLPDGLDRLGEPHAVGHVPRGGRARPARRGSTR